MDFYRNNAQLNLALQFVQQTSKHIFLTGKAGTGKTTFLHNLKKVSHKRMVVVAPTGVAAINAGGVTIHSFFQLPFGPQLPENNQTTIKQHAQADSNASRLQRFSREKINIIKSLDLLVIDEISMVRADLLDGIDGVLRRFRNRNKPFGGVQLLMIGDLQQLAPIAKEDEWNILSQYYETVYFFSSKALKQTNYVSIELTHIFRQSEKVFITLLNNVRNKNLDAKSIELLNKRHIPNFSPKEDEGYITLTTHNHQAKSINSAKLNALQSKPHKFVAEVIGDFPEHSYPTDFELTLKEGSQVMFVKNDPSYEKLFFNGKIGTLVSIDEETIYVQCPDDDFPIAVTPLEWENTKYSIDPFSKEIKEQVTGNFIQYPLKLAWAITIHKSQGLTFEKAIIDAQAAFAHGQVYVALSRCKSLDGLVLSTPINNYAIVSDDTVKDFSKNIEENPPSTNDLEIARITYQKELVNELFDFQPQQKLVDSTFRFVRENKTSFHPSLTDCFHTLSSSFKASIFDVGKKFTAQLNGLIAEKNEVEKNSKIQERLKKAADYFLPKIEEEFLQELNSLITETDSTELKSKIKDYLERINKELYVKNQCLIKCKNGFKVSDFIEAKAKASIEKPPKKRASKKTVDESVTISKHIELYNRLKIWRNALASERGWQVYRIIRQSAMIEIANELPYHKSLLKKVKGMGKKKIEEFGSDIIKMVTDFRAEKNMPIPEGDIFEEEEAKHKKKIKSHLVSFQMFQEGKSIEQIARERNLTESTISGHLAGYVESGDISIEKLLPKEQINRITNYFINTDTPHLTPAREALNEEFSYSQLRWVLKHLQQIGRVNFDNN